MSKMAAIYRKEAQFIILLMKGNQKTTTCIDRDVLKEGKLISSL